MPSGGERTPRADQDGGPPKSPLFLRGASSANGAGTRFDGLEGAAGSDGVLRVVRSGLLGGDIQVGGPDDSVEHDARAVALSVSEGRDPDRAPAPGRRAPPSPSPDRGASLFADAGAPLDAHVRRDMEPKLDCDLEDVRVHTGPDAADLATTLGARAFTLGRHVGFGRGAFAPGTASGDGRLAHELTHVAQGRGASGGRPVIRRETPNEVIDRFKNWGGLNLREQELGTYLAGQVRAGRYTFTQDVIVALSSSDRDDVAVVIVVGLVIPEIIRIAHDPAGLDLLRLMRDELGGGWTTEGEQHQVDLIDAVLNRPGARLLWNRERIASMKQSSPSDLESLASLFDDDTIIDDGSVNGRLQAILDATEHLVIPGLQTGIDFSDTGFAGTRDPGGPGFRDPHPSSRNQVGHFLTAVGLEFSPGVVSRPITGLDLARRALNEPGPITIREMVGAPAGMSDADVATRLTIGHEKAPDPSGAVAALNIVVTGFLARLTPGPEGETEDQQNERVGRAIIEETRRQMNAIIAAFRRQFVAATDDDVRAWNDALTALGPGVDANLPAAEGALARVDIDVRPDADNRGNSVQDLRLSLVGWRLGQLLQAGSFPDRHAVAAWIRRSLGPASP